MTEIYRVRGESGQPPDPDEDREAWLAYVEMLREQAMQQIRWADAVLVRAGRLKRYTLPKKPRY